MKQVVYLGPSISSSDLMLSHGTIFKNGIPSEVEDKFEDNPDLSSLFIPVERLAKSRIDLRNGNSHIATCYARIYNIYNQTKGDK